MGELLDLPDMYLVIGLESSTRSGSSTRTPGRGRDGARAWVGTVDAATSSPLQ